MKQWNIKVSLSDGDMADVNVVAENQAKALEILKANSTFLDFVGTRSITKVDIIPNGEYEPAKAEDYVLQKSEKKGFWCVADKVNNVVVVFEQGKYNDTAKITFLNDKAPSALDSATILRKIGEYIVNFHPSLL